MLETSNLTHKYTPICTFGKYVFWCLGLLHLADVNIFLQKNSVFCLKSTFTPSNKVRAVLEILSSVFIFFKTKGYNYWKHNFCRLCVRNPACGLFQISQKSGKWQWHHNFPTWRHRKLFWSCPVSLVKLNYWSKFHVNIITRSGIMTIFFYKGLTRNPEIGNTPVWDWVSYGYQIWHECL